MRADVRLDPYEIRADGRLRLHLHAGQLQAWHSTARFPTVIAGTQSGKTIFGPIWLWREIQQRGPGDYLVVTPTFPLLELKALPSFLRLFESVLGLGRYVGSPIRRFVVSRSGARRLFGSWDGSMPTQIFFGHAQDPDSLESATAKAAWLDEVGQNKFKLGSWEAVRRRLSIYQGRTLFTTTPYNLGWFKQEIHDRAQRDADYEVIRFASTENPAFPRAEMESARSTLPEWKYRMFYLGIFERPAGLIYDSFDVERCKVARFAIPDGWPRFLGLDFGGVNTVGCFYAQNPVTEQLFLYRTYHAGGCTAAEHVEALIGPEPGVVMAYGGAKSEGQWRAEFAAAGLDVAEPRVADVELGINRVYGAHKQQRIYVFADQAAYLDEKLRYARKLDDAGEVTEEIEDKSSFHYMDAERYVIGSICGEAVGSASLPGAPPVDPIEEADKDDW